MATLEQTLTKEKIESKPAEAYEPLLPVEVKLIVTSLAMGVVLLVVLVLLSRLLF